METLSQGPASNQGLEDMTRKGKKNSRDKTNDGQESESSKN